MEYITNKEAKSLQRQIEEIKNKLAHYEKHCKDYFIPCAICGQKSTTYVTSMVGSLKWYICNTHGEVVSYIGGGQMGIMINGVETPMPFLDDQHKAIKELESKYTINKNFKNINLSVLLKELKDVINIEHKETSDNKWDGNVSLIGIKRLIYGIWNNGKNERGIDMVVHMSSNAAIKYNLLIKKYKDYQPYNVLFNQ